jgi:hypothetical protein
MDRAADAKEVMLEASRAEEDNATLTLSCARLLLQLEEYNEALVLSHKALQQDRGNPEISLGYVGIVTALPEDLDSLRHDSVRVGSYVELKLEGEKLCYVIAAATATKLSDTEIPEDSETARALTGKKVGDKLKLDPSSESEAEILEIKSIYGNRSRTGVVENPINVGPARIVGESFFP